ncbi:hypothetical protein [Pseudomonas citronellolis]
MCWRVLGRTRGSSRRCSS